MSFSEPGRDDSNLPPVNIVIPDDARELERDVLAYRRELRAERRRQRLLRLLRPFRSHGAGGHTTVIPLIAGCLAIVLVGGALLSVATMNPASAPTLSSPQMSAQPSVPASGLPTGSPSMLPAGNVQVNGHTVALRSLVTAAIALVPANCGCGPALGRLAAQSVAAHVGLYFAGTGAAIPQLPALATRDGDGAAVVAVDRDGLLSDAYHPTGLTVLLVFKDTTAAVVRNLSGNFHLTPALRELKLPGDSRASG